jgi:ribonuclease P protein component
MAFGLKCKLKMEEKCYLEDAPKVEKDLLSVMNSKRQHTLPRGVTLKSKSDIERVIKSGKKISKNIFDIYINQSDKSGVAFLVSRKIGSAVKRNHMKRLFRESFRINKQKFHHREVVFIIKHYLNDFQKIFTETEKLK